MPSHGLPDSRRGTIVAIGGAEDKVRQRLVLQRIVKLAGGRKAHIAVVPTASRIPREMIATYERVFTELGASKVTALEVGTREHASDEGMLRVLEDATLVFLTGGDQLRLVSAIGGTPFAMQLRKLNAAGLPIAGTSAGAGVLCQHMIARGRSGQWMNQSMVSLAPGLGLSNRIVIDQHFSQRHRMGRLFTAVSLNPFLVGVGIDEDTAIALDADNRLHVWGRGSVTVVDGADITRTDVAEVDGRKPGSVFGLRVHVLTEGCSYDLIERRGHAPGEKADPIKVQENA